MKNTLITLASVATLAGAANAQTYYAHFKNAVTNGTDSYGVNSYVRFNSITDFAAGSNGTVIGHTNGQDFGSMSDDTNHYILNGDNKVYTYAGVDLPRGNTPVVIPTSAAYFTAASDVFSLFAVNGSFYTHFKNAVTNGTDSYGVNSYVRFNSIADFTAGTNGIVVGNTNGQDSASMSDGTNHYIINGDNKVYTFSGVDQPVGAPVSPTSLAYFTRATDLHSAFAVSTTTVPEPSSTALLGLGVLGLLARRKR